jgi:glycosyltransferase involved in cell wall biosynthesis
MKRTLYLCYFGLREPLVQTQVLPYLREIAKAENLKVSLLTFEPDFKQKWTSEQIESEKQNLAAENIDWHALAYHKNPSAPATVYDVLNGARFIRKLSRIEKIDFLHARAHIPALMALVAARFTKSRIVFDIRGLMAEEYADAGIWRENSKPFRFIKYVERKAIEKAAQIVVLTERMRAFLVENNLKKRENVEVIPCCVDFSRIENAGEIAKSNRFELIYAGTVTGLYLLCEMGAFFQALKKQKPNAFFRILTASPPEIVREIFDELGIDKHDYAAAKVAPAEVPEYLKRAHLGVSFRKPTFSQIAASPTKIPEYLACGLPVVSNSGIGDTDALIETENVGAILNDFTEKDFANALEKIDALCLRENLAEHCFETARKYFDLSRIGGERYRRVYQKLLQ